MNTPRPLSRRHFALAVFALGLAALIGLPSASAADNPGQLYATVVTQPGLTASQVKDVVVRSLVARRWSVQSQADDKVVGYLKHRSNEATLTLVYDAQKVEIYCSGWKIDKSTGTRISPELPERWLKNMRNDLTRRLNPAAAIAK